MNRKRKDFDAGLPPWLVQLFDAGRELATIAEEHSRLLQAMPRATRPIDDDAQVERDARAIHAWAWAVVAARKANGQ